MGQKYLEIWVAFKEIVEVKNRLLKVTTLVKDVFVDFHQSTVFVGHYGGSSRYIVDQRNLSERISAMILD